MRQPRNPSKINVIPENWCQYNPMLRRDDVHDDRSLDGRRDRIITIDLQYSHAPADSVSHCIEGDRDPLGYVGSHGGCEWIRRVLRQNMRLVGRSIGKTGRSGSEPWRYRTKQWHHVAPIYQA